MASPLARELTVDVPADREGVAVAAVHALGVMGVQIRDRTTGAPRGRSHVLAWLPPTEAAAAAAAQLQARLGPDARVGWRDVLVTWDTGPAAHPVGDRFAVVAPGADPPEGRVPLVLEAALAFGDGLHPTTALCVEALERRLGRGAADRAIADDDADGANAPATDEAAENAATTTSPSLLDVGTGTGILALVAARLGARPVVAQDVDPLAVWAARRTVAANAVDVDVVEALPDGRFDVVVANLYLAPLLQLVPALATRCAPGGTLLVSGFVADALATVLDACAAAGLHPITTTTRDGWCAVELRASKERDEPEPG